MKYIEPTFCNKWLAVIVCVFITLTGKIVCAASFAYSYDSLNRITNTTYSDGSAEKYLYDLVGNRLSRITLPATTRIDTTAPPIPTNVVPSSVGPSQLAISWNQVVDTGGSGLAGYQIYVNGSVVATTSSTNYILTGLAPNSSYCITIAAFDHYNNLSAQSLTYCTNTAVVQPPFLVPLKSLDNHFQIGITGGTPGPYNVLISTQLPQWNTYGNLVLPQVGASFLDPATGRFSQRFYRLQWNTNVP